MNVQRKGLLKAVCRNPDGSLAWEHEFPNGVTTEGLTYLQGAAFAGTTQISNWYFLLISGTSYSALAAGDTMGSHAGWTEFTGYSQSTRPAWSNTTSGASTFSSAAATFTVNAAGTVVGVGVVSENTKSGTTGTLLATGLFPSTRTLVSGQTIEFSYTNSSVGG